MNNNMQIFEATPLYILSSPHGPDTMIAPPSRLYPQPVVELSRVNPPRPISELPSKNNIELTSRLNTELNLFYTTSFKVTENFRVTLGYCYWTNNIRFTLMNELTNRTVSMEGTTFIQFLHSSQLNIWRCWTPGFEHTLTADIDLNFKLPGGQPRTHLSIEKSNDENVLKIANGLHNSVSLDVLSIQYLYGLRGILKFLYKKYYDQHEEIKSYYRWYIFRCRTLRLSQLSQIHFAEPSNNTNNIEYIRLFDDISMLTSVENKENL